MTTWPPWWQNDTGRRISLGCPQSSRTKRSAFVARCALSAARSTRSRWSGFASRVSGRRRPFSSRNVGKDNAMTPSTEHIETSERFKAPATPAGLFGSRGRVVSRHRVCDGHAGCDAPAHAVGVSGVELAIQAWSSRGLCGRHEYVLPKTAGLALPRDRGFSRDIFGVYPPGLRGGARGRTASSIVRVTVPISMRLER